MMSGSLNGNLVGDFIDTVRWEGCADGKKVPFELTWGRNGIEAVNTKAGGLIELCEKWGHIFRAQTSNE